MRVPIFFCWSGAQTRPRMMSEIHIHRYSDVLENCTQEGREALARALDGIFFQSSNTKSFAGAQARADFRERWFGRYLSHDPQWAYVAFTPEGEPAGYLVGSIDDPVCTPRFADIGYFGHFAALTSRYPAHLHINLAERCRSGGIGSRLVTRFCIDAAKAGAPGVHVVTSRGARNVRFYERNGFLEAGCQGEGAKEVVFLAKALGSGGPRV